MDRTKEYYFVLSTMPRLHARSRLLELDVFFRLQNVHLGCLSNYVKYKRSSCFNRDSIVFLHFRFLFLKLVLSRALNKFLILIVVVVVVVVVAVLG